MFLFFFVLGSIFVISIHPSQMEDSAHSLGFFAEIDLALVEEHKAQKTVPRQSLSFAQRPSTEALR